MVKGMGYNDLRRRTFLNNKRKNNKNYNKKNQSSLITTEEAKKLLNQKEENIKMFVEKAKTIAENLRISSNQFRKFFDEIKKIKEYNEVKLELMKPKFYYAVRNDKQSNFPELMITLIDETNKNNFNNLIEFLEAIIAYRKYQKND